MLVQVTKWGNSLGVRLPRALAKEIGIDDGQKVNIVTRGNTLVIELVAPRYRIEDLLANITPEAMRTAFDWGPDRGRESVDE